MDPREARLPVWAQQLIADLRKRVTSATEPLARELAKLRPQAEVHQRRFEAMTELLQCAANGQHLTAAEIVKIIKTYNLTLTQGD